MKFCLLAMTGSARPAAEAEFVFFAHATADLADAERRFTLTPDDFELLNPNTRTCPIFRTRRDAEITKGIYRRIPVLVNDNLAGGGNPWGVRFLTMFHMANDSSLFRDRTALDADGFALDGNVFRNREQVWLPLYEAKMVHHFNHRFASFVEQKEDGQFQETPDSLLKDPNYASLPRYWVPGREVAERLREGWDGNWLFGWRNICRNTDERTLIASVIPKVGIGHSMPFVTLRDRGQIMNLIACLTSFVMDYIVRQKAGGTNLTFFIMRQLPVYGAIHFTTPLPWDAEHTVTEWVWPRVLELTYTSWELSDFAQDQRYQGAPFRWEPERRFLLRAELEAAFFHFYGVGRDNMAYIFETFPIVRSNDQRKWGEYRTKRVVLEIYDAMARAIETGEAYMTLLDPPPADPSIAHRKDDVRSVARITTKLDGA